MPLNFVNLVTSVALMLISLPVISDIGAPPPRPGYQHSVSFGISKGEQNERDADFYGWSVDYSRHLQDQWSVFATLMWDSETERFTNKSDVEEETFTLASGINYALSNSVSVATGLSKGFADTDNSNNSMQFSNGDLGTGLVLAFNLPKSIFTTRDSLGLSFSYEYNISAEETSVSADLVIGFSF